ncbi:hypothetical protein [Krasilnikovia sp. MM14-A1004]|uniref:hypothetical protein n=1 Tax=Krasilnikovia sp. MM14-A1004 TaxID=3373541 RepID=UPI00399CDC1D
MPEPDDDGLVPPMKVLRKRLNGVYRADGLTAPTRRYVLIVALLVGLASLPVLAAITAGRDSIGRGRTGAMDVPLLPPASSGPVRPVPGGVPQATPPASSGAQPGETTPTPDATSEPSGSEGAGRETDINRYGHSTAPGTPSKGPKSGGSHSPGGGPHGSPTGGGKPSGSPSGNKPPSPSPGGKPGGNPGGLPGVGRPGGTPGGGQPGGAPGGGQPGGTPGGGQPGEGQPGGSPTEGTPGGSPGAGGNPGTAGPGGSGKPGTPSPDGPSTPPADPDQPPSPGGPGTPPPGDIPPPDPQDPPGQPQDPPGQAWCTDDGECWTPPGPVLPSPIPDQDLFLETWRSGMAERPHNLRFATAAARAHNSHRFSGYGDDCTRDRPYWRTHRAGDRRWDDYRWPGSRAGRHHADPDDPPSWWW